MVSLRVALRHFQAATNEITRAHGLTPRQYDLLAILHGGDSRRRVPSVIAADLRLERNTMTELVTRAVKAGLVRREPVERDGRFKQIRPTEEGTRCYLAAVAELRPARGRLLALLREAAVHAQALSARIGPLGAEAEREQDVSD